MAGKKRFNDYIGFLWNAADIQRVETVASQKGVTSSHILREAALMYLAIQEGRATLTYNAPITSTPAPAVEASTEPAETPSDKNT